MPPRRRKTNELIDLEGEDDGCKSKRSRTSRRPVVKISESSNNSLPSFYDNLPLHRSSKHIVTSREEKKKDKLDTHIFELYMEDLWTRIDEDKKSVYTYFDSLWFNNYIQGMSRFHFPGNRGHWSLLVLCHFDNTDCSDTKKGPRMLVLDSLNTAGPTRVQSSIRRFILDIYKTEEREESKDFIDRIRLEFPKVPQQNGEECGIYVLYFIYCFLQNRKLAEVIENKGLEEDFSQLFDDGSFDPEELENFRNDVHLFQANRSTKTEE
ncbi:hypothetical protein BRADI_4g22347v3 [Brachypodium distachyon]|uniref:Ubiquitin-like protease family profile domain-containing protein n=1 Tax=Brachypodium distachyon TaxID=15368 RepID=A0A2K2CPG5_BRADI|nr:hypothetical protein BRADI_4g22347v3 [Brachypodium distachyon]